VYSLKLAPISVWDLHDCRCKLNREASTIKWY